MTDRVVKKIAEFVAKFEGFRAHSYFDLAEVATIGYGHVVTSDNKEMEISPEVALSLLEQDVLKAFRAVNRLISFPMNDNQLVALSSFCYNVGAGALQRSTLRSKFNRGDIEGAADEFLRWNKVAGRPIRGLTNRRTAERKLFLT